MTLVLGIDGGQSAIRVGHSATQQAVELPGVSRQDGDAVARTASAAADGWRQLGCPPVERAVLGLTAAPASESDADRLCALVATATQASEVWVTDDSVTNHAGALAGRPGISLTVGTGVACLAVSSTHGPQAFGGHGYLLGDEGGGYWIGRRGIGAVLRAFEGRAPATGLTPLALARFGEMTGMHVRIHDGERPVDAIAQFAPDVLAAAADADGVASGIVDDAVDELVDVVRAAAGYVGVGVVDLALGGRLMTEVTSLRSRLEDRLGSMSGLAVRDAAGSSLDGALLLGRQHDPGTYAPLVMRWQAGPA